ncbi:MAG: type II toxin-antitoxin system prevent-host-death family antitoxin [Bryobacteraceae bacterium]
MTKRIAAGEFKAKCLGLLDEVNERRMRIIVTKRGKPVAKVVPINRDLDAGLFGKMKGTVKILGDIVEPTGEIWDAER